MVTIDRYLYEWSRARVEAHCPASLTPEQRAALIEDVIDTFTAEPELLWGEYAARIGCYWISYADTLLARRAHDMGRVG